MQITDTHLGDSEREDDQTVKLMEKMLDIEQPDLVVLTGDMVSGYAWDGTRGWYFKHWAKWTSPFMKKRIPYIYALGNHDAQADLTRSQIIDLDIQHPYSLTQKGADHLEGNNFLHSIKDESGQTVFHLWIFDTLSEDCNEVKGYCGIGKNTL